jgi:O-antigen/teichoic acid export membrane protein
LAPKTELLILIGGRLGAALIALLALRAVTTLLLPEEYGELSLLVALQMFCGLILINPVGQYINLRTHAWWDDGSLMSVLKRYQKYVLLVACVGAVLTLAVGTRHPDARLVVNCLAVLFMVVSATWNATLVSMLNMLGFRAASVFWGLVTAFLGTIVAIALVSWFPTATAWFLGQAVGMAVGALGAYLRLAAEARAPLNLSKTSPVIEPRDISSYLLPLALATALMWLQLSGYRYMVEWHWGLIQLGFLAVGLQLSGQIWGLVESLCMQFLYPLFFRRINDDKSAAETISAVSDLANALVPVYLVFAGLLVAAGPYLLKLLVAPQYSASLPFVYLGAVIELCRGLANVLSTAAQAKNNTRTLFFPYALGSLVTIGLIQWFASERLPVDSVGVALLAGIIAMAIAMLVSMRRLVRFRLDWTRCVAAGLVAVVFGTTKQWVPEVSGVLPSIATLLFLSLVALAALTILLRGNPALARLLDVKLKGN